MRPPPISVEMQQGSCQTAAGHAQKLSFTNMGAHVAGKAMRCSQVCNGPGTEQTTAFGYLEVEDIVSPARNELPGIIDADQGLIRNHRHIKRLTKFMKAGCIPGRKRLLDRGDIEVLEMLELMLDLLEGQFAIGLEPQFFIPARHFSDHFDPFEIPLEIVVDENLDDLDIQFCR